MLIWLVLAILSVLVIVSLVRPLTRDAARPVSADAADIAVYRDQLAEIEADKARGTLREEEAAAARAEVARRLLARAGTRPEAEVAAAPGLDRQRARTLSLIVAAAVPLVAVAVYVLQGSPWLPARPFATIAAVPPSEAKLGELIARVEARLREHPEDGAGWDVIAPVYLAEERYGEAAEAFSRAIRLLGESPRRLAGLAEALVIANNGLVGEAARSAYERLLALEPDLPEPRFWLAYAKEQDGKLTAAADEYRALLTSAPEGAPWGAMVRERLAAVETRLGRPSSPPEPGPAKGAARGPTEADVAAAAQLSVGDRAEMIKQMVAGLAERLDKDGRDLEGWIRLVRAYKVMGREADAVAALGRARKALGSDPAALSELTSLAKSLGLGS